MLTLEKITKRYPAPEGVEPLRVLQDVDLKVEDGASLAIVGPSGSGKSTLLNIIGTLDRPASGKVTLGGRDLLALNDEQLAALRNAEIGFVFQSHHLLPHCTVLENVLVPTLACADPALKQGAPDRAHELLKKVGLEARATHRPAQLSGGERQRVAVVRALINRPKLLLADEPTGSLDRASAENLTGLLADLNQDLKVTLIVVTHAAPLAARMARTMELRDGRLSPALESAA